MRLVIVGDGPLRMEVETLCKKNELTENVKFLGIRSDIPSLMSAVDAFVLASVVEGLPMVLLEAAACALPAVVTNVGGNSEIVEDGIIGFVVPPRDSRALYMLQ